MESQEIRSSMLDLLSRLYLPATPEDLSLCVEVTTGLRVPQETVGNPARQDFDDFSRGIEQDVWICPALDYPSGSADYDYLTRSDWHVRSRLVEGALSEAQELMLLWRLSDIAAIAEERRETGEPLRRLMDRIYDLTIQIPGSMIQETRSRRTVPTSDVLLYREIAEDLYGPLVRVERDRRREVASAIEELTPRERYFGR